MHCGWCGYERRKLDHFLGVCDVYVLEERDTSDLEKLMLQPGETLEGFCCPQCKKKDHVKTKDEFQKLPDILLVKLNRVGWENPDAGDDDDVADGGGNAAGTDTFFHNYLAE